MRLIDADALYYEIGASDRDIYAKCLIEDAPTIDPVTHGKWIKRKECGVWYDVCSLCGEYKPSLNFFGKPCKNMYCPNCGAKMDLED